jgi:hypothetical protein
MEEVLLTNALIDGGGAICENAISTTLTAPPFRTFKTCAQKPFFPW